MLVMLGFQGYFTVFRLTPQASTTKTMMYGVSSGLQDTLVSMIESVNLIKTLAARLAEIETQLKLRQIDSGRIVEWLDKRDKDLLEFQQHIVKSMHLEEREKRLDHHQTEIIQLGEKIRLIREKK